MLVCSTSVRLQGGARSQPSDQQEKALFALYARRWVRELYPDSTTAL